MPVIENQWRKAATVALKYGMVVSMQAVNQITNRNRFELVEFIKLESNENKNVIEMDQNKR